MNSGDISSIVFRGTIVEKIANNVSQIYSAVLQDKKQIVVTQNLAEFEIFFRLWVEQILRETPPLSGFCYFCECSGECNKDLDLVECNVRILVIPAKFCEVLDEGEIGKIAFMGAVDIVYNSLSLKDAEKKANIAMSDGFRVSVIEDSNNDSIDVDVSNENYEFKFYSNESLIKGIRINKSDMAPYGLFSFGYNSSCIRNFGEHKVFIPRIILGDSYFAPSFTIFDPSVELLHLNPIKRGCELC